MEKTGAYQGGQYLSHSKLQSPLTTKWLNEHYEVAEGVSLPRSSLYQHYLDFCQKSALNPVNAASFGKIIRHNFPNLKTRRLGTRGQSKYHYYGITIKKSSPYHETLLNNGRQPYNQTYSTTKNSTPTKNQLNNTSKHSTHSQQHSLMSSSGGTLLPSFPKIESLKLPSCIPKDKVRTFLIMYRAHCQRILDTILRANFGEVQKFFVHFWQGMPEHILAILGCHEVINLIGVCDEILFKAIECVLIPGVLEPLPASLTQAIRQFATQLNSWIELSLTHLPDELKQKKLNVAKTFSKSLRRKTSLTHLAQAARTVLHSSEPVMQMASDWKTIDFDEITNQTLWTFSSSPDTDYLKIETFLQQFTQLLEQQANIDQYAEWASNLVDQCLKSLEKDENEEKVKDFSREFLLKWSFFGNQIMRELTLKSAQSFGSFHLLHILLEDYIVYCVECKTSRDHHQSHAYKEQNIPVNKCASINEMQIQETKAVNESMKVTINNFETEAVKTTTNQNISGRENFNGTKSPIEIDDSSDQMEIENPHTDVIPATDANTSWNTKSRLYNTSKTNNYTPEGRYSGTMLERSTDMTSGSCLTYVPSFDALTPFNPKEYSPVPQDTRSYFGRFYIPNMVETLCTRNFYSPVNRHFSQESIPERIVYERQLFNRLPTENNSSVMGMF
ncbi:transcription factor RFX4-like [Xenia sp. Carnegie-2017]|uniref:transcription factor RFX4-like n=1 Tax=Xenia sp. Carnegie-2017 TaxID=2897299 RepID=UPI001F04A5B4|nr:transcription factor RFX4-like [Xenia sp. Carnegie-2017]XP_046852563.1 transcription factor RFX4-like [Xenia sp. Carnegie-2017]XP_046852564.1 transcription factor RFX4-like [Xenia sp. Carnegie-2017]XP_046852565.1 transcription factor RFX4-like [Xenia sp. Carnegie-2017]